MGVIFGSGDEVFPVGYLFGTRAGDTVDSTPFGEVQETSLKDEISLQEAMGSTTLGASAVGLKSRSVQATAKWLRVRLKQFQAWRGGTLTFSSAATTYAASVNDSPKPVTMRYAFDTPATPGSELKLFNCIAPSLNMPFQNRDFAFPDVQFNVYGNGTIFYSFQRPGDQTAGFNAAPGATTTVVPNAPNAGQTTTYVTNPDGSYQATVTVTAGGAVVSVQQGQIAPGVAPTPLLAPIYVGGSL